MEITKRLSDVKPEEVEDLIIKKQQRESKTLEYKQILCADNKSNNGLLKAVSAFANTSGGVLIYGVKENKKESFESGKRYEITGLKDIDLDEEIQRIENVLRNNIIPKFSGIQVQDFQVKDKLLILIKVSQSWHPPHMVSLDKKQKFYIRNSVGSQELDFEGIKNAFLLSEGISSKISNFRTERLGKIASGETPCKMDSTTSLVLHLLPLQAFKTENKPNIPLHYQAFPEKDYPKPMVTTSCTWAVNFDGFLSFYQEHPTCSYLQMFHNGCMEAVETFLLQDGEFPLLHIISTIVQKTEEYLAIQKKVGIECPTFIAVSLIDVKGNEFDTSSIMRYGFSNLSPVDRNNLILPEVMLDNYEQDVSKKLKPIFDQLANAVGLSESPPYDNNGNVASE